MYLSLEVEDGYSTTGINGEDVLIFPPKICLYEYTDQGQVFICSVSIEEIMQAWKDHCNRFDL